MTQKVVTDNLSIYLDSLDPAIYPEAKNISADLKGGDCFALSAIHGALDDKLDWYEESLVLIANWDRKLESLEKPVLLPQADHNQAVPFKTIFNRVTNYIIQIQARKQIKKILTDLDHWKLRNILINLEVTRNGKICKVYHHECAANYYTEAQLHTLINRNIEGNICIVDNGFHAIRIGYKHGKWFVYNPNYSHLSKATIRKTFTTKTGLVNEIIKIQGHSLNIQVASFDRNFKLPHISKKVPACLQGLALYLIAIYNPKALPNIFKQITAAISEAEKNNKTPHEIFSQFSQALFTPNVHSNRAFFIIAQCSPRLISDILNFIAKMPDRASVMSKLLCAKLSTGENGLYFLARYAQPHELQQALKLVSGGSPETLLTVTNAFIEPGTNNQIPLNSLTAETWLPTIETLATFPNGCITLAKALEHKTVDSWGLLFYVLSKAPQACARVLELALQAPNGFSSVTKALMVKNNKDETSFDWINKYHSKYIPTIANVLRKSLLTAPYEELFNLLRQEPDTFRNIFKLISTLPDIHNATADVLCAQKYGWNTLHYLAHYTSDLVIPFLNLATQASASSLTNITNALGAQNSDGYTILQMLPADQISPVLEVIAKLPNGCTTLANIVALKNKHGWSTLHTIISKAPDTLSRIFALALQVPNGSLQVAQALLTKNNDGQTVLDWINKYRPDRIPQISASLNLAAGVSLMTFCEQHIPSLKPIKPVQMVSVAPVSVAPVSVVIPQNITDIQKYIVEIKTTIKSNNNKKQLINLINYKDKSDNRGLYLLYKHNPEILRAVLTYLNPSSQIKNNNTDAIQMVLNSYVIYKNHTLFGRWRWQHTSKESLNMLAQLLATDDNKQRLALAQAYIKLHPNKQLAIELRKNIVGLCI